jgi:hypothetical protein
VKNAVSSDLALRDAAASFFKEVRQDAVVNDRNIGDSIGHDELSVETIAFECAFLDEAADAKRATDRRFIGCHIRGTKEEDEIISKSTRNQIRREPQARKSDKNERDPFMTSFH